MIHIRNVTDVPCTNVVVKVCLVPKGFGHIRHARNIPVANVTISESGGFVCAPQVDRGLEVCVCKNRWSGNAADQSVVQLGLDEKDEWIRPLCWRVRR